MFAPKLQVAEKSKTMFKLKKNSVDSYQFCKKNLWCSIRNMYTPFAEFSITDFEKTTRIMHFDV
jgi:hypothetical protein